MRTQRPLQTGSPHSRAFTLIELLVVIAIISILAALTMGIFHFAQQSSSRNRTIAGLAAIVNALEQYKEKFGEYPEPVDKTTRGSGSSSGLRTGGALMLYQAISGDGYDKIEGADKASPTGPAVSDGKVDSTESANSIRGDLPKSMVLNTVNGYMLIDGFGRPYEYEKGGSPDAVNKTFDVWSLAQQWDLESSKRPNPNYEKIATKSDALATAIWIKNW